MGVDTYPKFRAAAIQAAPVFLDRDGTIDRVEEFTREASSRGAKLVVFGESFVPAFPFWNLVIRPVDQHDFFRELYDNAIEIPSPQFQRLSKIASDNKVFLSVGITEKSPVS